MDGEIDLSTCCDVTEYPVQRNYGFQIHVSLGWSLETGLVWRWGHGLELLELFSKNPRSWSGDTCGQA